MIVDVDDVVVVDGLDTSMILITMCFSTLISMNRPCSVWRYVSSV